MVLVCIVDMVLQVALPAVKVHISVKQLVLILSVLLLSLINGIEPQVEVAEVVIHVLIEVCSIKTRGAHLSATPNDRWGILLLLNGDNSRTTGNIRTYLKDGTTTTYISTIATNIPTVA